MLVLGDGVLGRELAPVVGALGRHGGTDQRLDAIPFALAHPAVQRHDEVVGVASRVDWSADLGHPERDAVVHEDRERQTKLVSVERPLRFTNDHGIKATAGIRQAVEKTVRLGPALPGKRSRLADVEELLDDLAIWLD